MADGSLSPADGAATNPRCPYCQHPGSRIRSTRYVQDRKIEKRECDSCQCPFETDAAYAISAAEARALSGERTGA